MVRHVLGVLATDLLPVTPAGVQGNDEAPPPLSVIGQPLDGAPAVVHVLHFRFQLGRIRDSVFKAE